MVTKGASVSDQGLSSQPGAVDEEGVKGEVYGANDLPEMIANMSKVGKLLLRIFKKGGEVYEKDSLRITLDMLKNANFSLDDLFAQNNNKPLYLFVKQRGKPTYYFIEATEEKGSYTLIKFNRYGKKTPYGDVSLDIQDLREGHRGYITLPDGKGQIKTGVIE